MGWLTVKTLIVDVIIPIVDKVFDVLVLLQYFNNGDYWWMGTTIFAIALPGILEVIYYVFADDEAPCTTVVGLVCFGPWLFPVSSILWHLFVVCQGEDEIRRKYPKSMVLNGLQAFSESSLQFLLQTHILMTTWTSLSDNYLQVGSAALSMIALAYNSVEHHLFEVNAKERPSSVLPSLQPAHLLYLVHVFCRTTTVAILTSYLRIWSLIPGLLFVGINFWMSGILKTDMNKRIWTSLTSIASPVCYVSKSDVKETLNDPPNKFYQFYVANTGLFAALAIVSVVAVNGALLFGRLSFDCDDLPFLSCPTDPDCHRPCGLTSPKDPNYDFHTYGTGFVVGASILHLIWVSLQNCCFPILAKSQHSVMAPI